MTFFPPFLRLDAMRCDYQDRVEPDDRVDIPTGVQLKTLL